MENLNIRQKTNFDLSGGGFLKTVTINGQSIEMWYQTIPLESSIKKFGYCCEPKAIAYPLVIQEEGEEGEKEIQIGKTGMFEVQPEEFQEKSSKTEDIEIIITSIKVPWSLTELTQEEQENYHGFNFTLDYVTAN